MTLPQQDPVRGKCLLCNADNHELFHYLDDYCVCRPCLDTIHELGKLSGQNAEAAKWLDVAETYVKKQRVENAPCLEYARRHWRDALCSVGEDDDDDDEDDWEEGRQFTCESCEHYEIEEDDDEDDDVTEECAVDSGAFFTNNAKKDCRLFKLDR